MTNCGSRVAYVGTMSEDTRRKKMRLRPGKRSRAKPYAASVHDSSVPMITSVTMVIEFQRYRQRGAVFATSEKFSKWSGQGIQTGGQVYTSLGDLSAVVISQKNGKMMTAAPSRMTTYARSLVPPER